MRAYKMTTRFYENGERLSCRSTAGLKNRMTKEQEDELGIMLYTMVTDGIPTASQVGQGAVEAIRELRRRIREYQEKPKYIYSNMEGKILAPWSGKTMDYDYMNTQERKLMIEILKR